MIFLAKWFGLLLLGWIAVRLVLTAFYEMLQLLRRKA